MTAQDESALVCAARRGDKEALQLLLRRHWAWLKGLVYGVLEDSRDLDDVLQDGRAIIYLWTCCFSLPAAREIALLRETPSLPTLAPLGRSSALVYENPKRPRSQMK